VKKRDYGHAFREKIFHTSKVSENYAASFRDAVLWICTVNCIANMKTMATTKKLTLKLAKLAYLGKINNYDSRFVSSVK